MSEKKVPKVGPQAPAPPVMVVCGVLYREQERYEEALAVLCDEFGELELPGPVVPFDRTDYYAPEMGQGLQRRYLCFASLRASEELVSLKARSWEIEQGLGSTASGGRVVNIDPGYLDHTKVVLASFKQGPQKLHLGQGVWADMVLYYADGAYGPLPWTFPDLRGDEHWAFFAAARVRYKAQLKKWRAAR